MPNTEAAIATFRTDQSIDIMLLCTKHPYLLTLPSENFAPLVSWMALGTAFSTFSGSPSCIACGTLDSPVACETLPVCGLAPVS